MLFLSRIIRAIINLIVRFTGTIQRIHMFLLNIEKAFLQTELDGLLNKKDEGKVYEELRIDTKLPVVEPMAPKMRDPFSKYIEGMESLVTKTRDPYSTNLFRSVSDVYDNKQPVNFSEWLHEKDPAKKNKIINKITDDLIKSSVGILASGEKLIAEKKEKELEPVAELVDEEIDLDCEIDNVKDLIKVLENNDFDNKKFKKLKGCIPQLKEMVALIGMESIKQDFLDMIISYMVSDVRQDLYNCVLYGAPGCGKTTVAKIMGTILSKLIWNKEECNFVSVKAKDLVGKYTGHTFDKTSAIINKAKNGVLFIDEVYALSRGKASNADHAGFEGECIDTLCGALTDEPIICIIAGYEDDVEKRFFALNEGLRRRFPFTFTIEDYKPEEMEQMFYSTLKKYDFLESSVDLPVDFFKDNLEYFPFFGGSINNFIDLILLKRNRRLLFKFNDKVIREEDITKAYEAHSKTTKRKNSHIPKYIKYTMYS